MSASSRKTTNLLLTFLVLIAFASNLCHALGPLGTCERALKVATHSKCPSSHWKDVLAPLLWPNATSPLIYVNAGANKGFAVPGVLALGPACECIEKHGTRAGLTEP